MDLKAYNDLTDQTPYVELTEGQYQTAVKKWQKYQEEKREWKSRDMQNNTLNTFKLHAVWTGIKPTGSLTLHGLRKSCITNWANEINNPEVVRRLAGHSDIKTTMQYYSAVTKEQREKTARAINELLKAE